MEIVCTIIPDARGVERFPHIFRAGMTTLRLNFSHIDNDGAARLVKAVRTFNELLDRQVGVMQDLRGRKMVLGAVPGGEQEVAPGVPVRFVDPGTEQDHHGYRGYVIPIHMDQPFADLHKAKCIVGKDASITFEIMDNRAKASGWIETEVRRGGVLRAEKGVNAPGIVRPTTLTQRDIEDLKFGLRLAVDSVCLSFVTSAKEIDEARKILGKSKRKKISKVWAKIECAEGVRKAREIIESADGIVIGRGDLAAETSRYEVAAIQTKVTKLAVKASKPCLLATGILESLRRSTTPSFAELRDLHHSVKEGVTGFVLTSETSIGRHPELAIEVILEAAAAAGTKKRPAKKRG